MKAQHEFISETDYEDYLRDYLMIQLILQNPEKYSLPVDVMLQNAQAVVDAYLRRRHANNVARRQPGAPATEQQP
jgi:hypothetical protein